MTRTQLIAQIKFKRSFLCIGLDTDITLIPDFLLSFENPVLEFNRRIIDATHDICVAYKPNSAFYESRGLSGWYDLINTWKHIPDHCMSIIDAKRGDIGNTSAMYAKAFFDEKSSGMSFDAITVAPYMGSDSVMPFLGFGDKWVIVLAHTSNTGSQNFQLLQTDDGHLYETVIKQVSTWATLDNLMFVVGATRAEAFETVRKHAPDHFLLVPGIGAQGGNLKDVCRYGLNKDCGLLVNASRSIIYATKDKDFTERAREEALKIRDEMELELQKIDF